MITSGVIIKRSFAFSRWDFFFKNPFVSRHVTKQVLVNNGKPHIYMLRGEYIQVSLSV